MKGLAIIALSLFLPAAVCADLGARLHAGWKVDQKDGLGDVYYFYPDGLFVRQGVRRREFVTIGHWKQEDQNRLILFDQQPRNTTLSVERLENIRNKKETYALVFDCESGMQWVPEGADARVVLLKRLRDLPDRTENVYWGLGTDESYRRAFMRDMGYPNLEKKKMKANHPPEPTPTSATAHQ